MRTKRHLIVAMALWTISVGALAKNPPTLRPLREQQHVDGAGCSFQFFGSGTKNRDVFEWDFEDEAWINLGGSDIRLKRLSSKEFPVGKKDLAVGDRRVLEFSGADVRVTVRTKTTSVCPEESESCEAWTEEGVIAVTSKKRSWTTRVDGLCGS